MADKISDYIKLIDSLSEDEYWALMNILLRKARKEMNESRPEPEPIENDLDRLLERNFLKVNK